MNIKPLSKFVIFISSLLLITATAFAQGAPAKTKTVGGSPTTWKTYSLCQDSVNVSFPSMPAEQVSSKDMGNNIILKIRTNVVDTESAIYMVSCFDGLPIVAEEMSPEFKKSFSDAVLKGFAQKIKEQMSSAGLTFEVKQFPVSETNTDGVLAYEQNFTAGRILGKSKVVFYGKSVVWMLMMTPNETSTQEKTSFFNSLTILPNQAKLLKLDGEDM